MCVELELGKLQFIFQNRSQGFFTEHKAQPGFFLCIFSSLTCLKKPEEGTRQRVTISTK
jgi:hypothetical protein